MKRKLVPVLILLLFPILTNCEKENDTQHTITITDFDGTRYKTVQIGDQIWMAENLKTTHYANGTKIELITDERAWGDLSFSDKAMSYYTNSIGNKEAYGALYTWAATMNDSTSSASNPSTIQGVCPDGWHLPSDNEWKELEMYLGMSQDETERYAFRGTNEGSKIAGDPMLWNEGILVTDVDFGSSGFDALPTGYRNADTGGFNQLHEIAAFWSATESGDTLSLSRLLNTHWTQIHRFTDSKKTGFSVRCIKD